MCLTVTLQRLRTGNRMNSRELGKIDKATPPWAGSAWWTQHFCQGFVMLYQSANLKNAQKILQTSEKYETCFVGFVSLRSTQEKCCFICFTAVCQGFSVFPFILSENGLMQNFWLESDKMVKPILSALCSCLVPMIILLDVFGYVCIPFLIYLVSSS